MDDVSDIRENCVFSRRHAFARKKRILGKTYWIVNIERK